MLLLAPIRTPNENETIEWTDETRIYLLGLTRIYGIVLKGCGAPNHFDYKNYKFLNKHS